MRKIIFGITGLTLGGAERVLVDIANELSEEFDVTIFTLYGKGEFEKELSSKVKLVNMIDKSYAELTSKERLKVSLKLLFNKKSIYKKYINNEFDTEIAFLEGPITRLFSFKNGKNTKNISNPKKIAWVHNDIGQVFGKSLKAKIKKKLDRRCYLQYDDIVFVSNDNLEQFEEVYNLNKNKMVIPNYISSKRVLEKSEANFGNVFSKEEINFLTVARLTDQKAIDRLIKVHSELMYDGHNHKFFVIGDGPEKENLKDLIEQLNVKDSFILLGKKENPYPYIKNCDVFALLSYYEGLPMTVLEARILEKPILITDTAAREAVVGYDKSYITENSENGIYVGIKDCIKMFPEWKNTPNQKYTENYEIIKQIEKLVK
ncbi:MAG: glycosyltransferase [Clostridia bacterium]|nr:glycosyltransferase [Clostridia bacterium]